MEFLPPREFERRLRGAERRRIAELRGLGIPLRDARSQAQKEFGAYDLIEMDEQGRIRMAGLHLPAE